MSIAAAHADAFYREVLQHRSVWTIGDDNGIPAPLNPSGERAMPFWSLRSRAQRVVDHVPAYAGFRIETEIGLDAFCRRWLPGLEQDGLLVGLNGSGKSATGFDLEPAAVLRGVEARLRTSP